MPKRSYPFGDSSPLQLKIHVGQRELCVGSCGEQYQRQVFEKTKKLLFSGARTYMDSMWNGSRVVQGCTVPQPPDCTAGKKTSDSDVHSLLQGQTLIGQDGKLLKSSTVHEKSTLPMGVSKACSSCVRSVGEKEACAQCERFICRNCSVLCSSCSAVTCSLCSVVDDGDICEKAFCYSCSLFEVSR